jgi:hypothetical protein
MGSKSKTGSAQKWAQPYAIAGAGEAQSVYRQNQPTQQKITDSIQSLIPGLTDRFKAGDPNVDAAQGYSQDVLGGKYLGANPQVSAYGGFSANPNIAPNGYLEDIIGQTNSDVTNATKGAFGSRGSFGGTAYIRSLSDSLAKNENNLRYNDFNTTRDLKVADFNRLQEAGYNDFNTQRGLNAANYATERNNQQQAMGAAPGLADAGYTGLAELLQAAGVGAALPYEGLGAYTGALGTLFNGGTQKGGIGEVLQGIGSIGSAAAKFSDRRLKTGIRKIGEFADKLGIYVWTYIWGGGEHIGVMADEIERLRPWALGPTVSGYQTVNYEAL